MNTKYENLNIDFKDYELNINRLTNQIWKLIPMKEHEENWESQLTTVLIELTGLGEVFCGQKHFLPLLSKLEGLRVGDWDFKDYRKTVFECISLLREIRL